MTTSIVENITLHIDFYQLKQDHGMEDCDLADEGKVPIGDLWSDLLIDFSFNMTKKMNDL